MSTTFRDMANNKANKHQWIVLDGDIDAEWIESANTVMVCLKFDHRVGMNTKLCCVAFCPSTG
jgi:hypothetical protein